MPKAIPLMTSQMIKRGIFNHIFFIKNEIKKIKFEQLIVITRPIFFVNKLATVEPIIIPRNFEEEATCISTDVSSKLK